VLVGEILRVSNPKVWSCSKLDMVMEFELG
jgi:hypothetical protein